MDLILELLAETKNRSFPELRELGASYGTKVAAEASAQRAFALKAMEVGAGSGKDWVVLLALQGAWNQVLRRIPDWPEADLIRALEFCARIDLECSPIAHFVKVVQSKPRSPGLMPPLDQIRAVLDPRTIYKEWRTLAQAIDDWKAGEPQTGRLRAFGEWSRFVFAEVVTLPNANAWKRAFEHGATVKSEPSKAWRSAAAKIIEEIGCATFLETATGWLKLGPALGRAAAPVLPEEGDILKGLLWFLPLCAGDSTPGDIADFAEKCFKKIPILGAVSQKAGNACVNVLAAIPGKESVTQLSRLSRRVRYQVAQRLIDEALQKAAAASGVTREELEEMTTPSYGMDADGVLVELMGDYSAELRITSGQAELLWKDSSGGVLKKMPDRLKETHADDVKELKAALKNIGDVFGTVRSRLERLMLTGREIPLERWRECYAEHPIVSMLARRLIWDVGQPAMWQGGGFVDCMGRPVPAGSRVRLWHPITSDVQTIFNWRCRLEDSGVQQPFKQAHREVYVLTPAEREAGAQSMRFAGHILRQHQFAALCRERGWQYRLMGQWDSHNIPVLELPNLGLQVQFFVDAAGEEAISGHAIYLYLETEHVSFQALNSADPIPLESIPARVFSEVMRDVDLFVGVTSVGADPAYGQGDDQTFATYWQGFSFGELSDSANHRRAFLEALIPKLAIRDRCRIEDKFLIVKGSRAEYKIHIGSGNVLMEPGSRYLCIVQGGSEANVRLPFEGDRTLSLILSKAFLLADDKKIKDVSILRQLP